MKPISGLEALPDDLLLLIAAHLVRAHGRIPPCAACTECATSLSEHAPISPYCRNKRPARALRALAHASILLRAVLRPKMWSCFSLYQHALLSSPLWSRAAGFGPAATIESRVEISHAILDHKPQALVGHLFPAEFIQTAIVDFSATSVAGHGHGGGEPLLGATVQALVMSMLDPSAAFSNLTHLRLHMSLASAVALLDPAMNPSFERIAYFALLVTEDDQLRSWSGSIHLFSQSLLELDLATVRFPACHTLEIVLAELGNVRGKFSSTWISSLPDIPACQSLTLAAGRVTWSNEPSLCKLGRLKLHMNSWESPSPNPRTSLPRLSQLDIQLHTPIALPLLDFVSRIAALDSLSLALPHLPSRFLPATPTLVLPTLRHLSARPPILSFVTLACELPSLQTLRAVHGAKDSRGFLHEWPVRAPTTKGLFCINARHRLVDYAAPNLERVHLDAECLIPTPAARLPDLLVDENGGDIEVEIPPEEPESPTIVPSAGLAPQWAKLRDLHVVAVSRLKRTAPEIRHDVDLYPTLAACSNLETLTVDLPSKFWPPALRGAADDRLRATKRRLDTARMGHVLRIGHAAAVLHRLTSLRSFRDLRIAPEFTRVQLFPRAPQSVGSRMVAGTADPAAADAVPPLELHWRDARSAVLWNAILARAHWHEDHRPSSLVVRVARGADAPRDRSLLVRVAHWVYGAGNPSTRAISFALGVGPTVKIILGEDPRLEVGDAWPDLAALGSATWSRKPVVQENRVTEDDLEKGWRAVARELRGEWIAPTFFVVEDCTL
ncbi:hypothetical protein BC828DRAFT_391582 [Blastocladiella britannica]|nr:hypothetical protein BC828DRAFT_391582 [Blastocladiella britannica]